MGKSVSALSRSRPIDKTLFAAGLQSAKRLYLDYHQPERAPASGPNREMLAEVGHQLLALARQAFPKGILVEGETKEQLAERTRELLQSDKPVVLFGALFRHENLEAQTDILIGSKSGPIDLYEVKSGTKVKTRHVMDVTFQTLVIEANGYTVRSANLLHLSSQYRHRTKDAKGAQSYPVQQLFKSSDLMPRVRKQLPRVHAQLSAFRAFLDDPSTVELPTGTFCLTPSRCPYLARCLDEGPEHPLLELPDLTSQQEQGFHAAAIESIAQLDPKQTGLTLVQRRALRAIHTGSLAIEPFVRQELLSQVQPLGFLDLESALQVLPQFDGARPWLQLPFQWSLQVLGKDGQVTSKHWLAEGRDDPRPEFVRSLAAALRGVGTLVVFGTEVEERLREMLEDLVEQKTELRAIINMPRLDLQRVVRMGVYHPEFRGSFELPAVQRALATAPDLEDVKDDETSADAYRRLTSSRTREKTRTKLSESLREYTVSRSQGVLAVFQALAGG